MDDQNAQVAEQDCAVCLQKCHYPTKLPCGHVFCFLCVKGVAIQSRKCAMCRAEIPPDYLDHPVLLKKLNSEPCTTSGAQYQWYYEGRNGWWKYDERSNTDLENAFIAQETHCKLLVAGALYYVNFQTMLQVHTRDTSKRRHVRRDVSTLPSKGIAGIKIIDCKESNQTKSAATSSTGGTADQRGGSVQVVHDTSAVQNVNTMPISTPGDSVSDIIGRISAINLQEPVESRESSASGDISDAEEA